MTDPHDLDALERELTQHASDALIYGSMLAPRPPPSVFGIFGVAFTQAAKLIARLRAAERERDVRNGTISMAVHRLGGLVEGRPTHEGNFLQRVDELVAIEAAGAAKDAEIAVFKKQLEGSFENAELQVRAHDAEYDALKAERDALQARVLWPLRPDR